MKITSVDTVQAPSTAPGIQQALSKCWYRLRQGVWILRTAGSHWEVLSPERRNLNYLKKPQCLLVGDRQGTRGSRGE